MILSLFLVFSFLTNKLTSSVTVGPYTPNTLLSFPITVDGVVKQTSLTLDANWRWVHKTEKYDNCFTDKWVCGTSEECTSNCQLEGVSAADWNAPYGVSVSGNSVTLKYVTQGPYGTNVGSRLYIVSDSKKEYQGFDMRNKEIAFTVDASKLPCGLNGAVYFSEIPLKNPYSTNLDSSFGINYGDAQCPKDIKYIQEKVNLGNVGACSNEYDLWEANSRATSLALHPCSIRGVTPCTTSAACGDGNDRFRGVCDKSGADYNPGRLNIPNFYGMGSTFKVDSTKPVRVITRFPTNSAGEIVKVERVYVQDGKTIPGGELTKESISAQFTKFGEPNRFSDLGGFKTMTESFARNHVLILSLWDDTSVGMRWLDSVYPVGSKDPGAYRGPCASHNNDPTYLRQTYPTSSVTYSDVKITSLSSTTPTPTPTPTPKCTVTCLDSTCKTLSVSIQK